MSEQSDRNVAIACQGGGSHTAYTAGVLKRLLPAIDERGDTLVGLSGTSGGAMSALAGWYGWLADDLTTPELLDRLWTAVGAETAGDRFVNDALVWGTRIETMGVPVPELSPYQHPGAGWGQDELRETLADVIDFDRIPDLASDGTPELIVGTVDINAGSFETYTNGDVTLDAMLATAAVPSLFPAVEIDGDLHWDGLFSQNPPIRDLYHVPPERKPDELWVVQINPQTCDGEPKSLREIEDRRNELAGNLSLNQEIDLVEEVNEFLAEGYLPSDEFRHTEVRRIQLGTNLGFASKLERRPEFITELMETGERDADAFLADLPES